MIGDATADDTPLYAIRADMFDYADLLHIAAMMLREEERAMLAPFCC